MFYLVYVSAAAEPLDRGQLQTLLATSRANNARLGVTGMLLYHDGNFLQVLEGERETVEGVFHTIQHDPRHRGVLRLLQGEVEHRHFPDWTMAYADLDGMPGPPGRSPFLDTPLTPEALRDCPSKVHRLLLSFKRTMQAHAFTTGVW